MHRRHDARRAVGRRGDDPAARRVLLVDRHRVDADEIHDLVRRMKVASGGLHQAVVDRPGAAHDLQAPRQGAGLPKAPLDAREHDVEDPLDMGAPRPSGRSAASFARMSPAIESPASRRRQKLGPRAEGIGKARLGADASAPAPSRMMKPPPTESQVSSASAPPSSSRATNRIVLGWRAAGVIVSKRMALSGSNAIVRRPPRLSRFVSRTSAISLSAASRSTVSGASPEKPQNHRLVGAVALSGEGERAKQRDLDRRRPADRARFGEPVGEGGRGLHRPDRMRRRGSDADLEQFEDADHRRPSGAPGAKARPLPP